VQNLQSENRQLKKLLETVEADLLATQKQLIGEEAAREELRRRVAVIESLYAGHLANNAERGPQSAAAPARSTGAELPASSGIPMPEFATRSEQPKPPTTSDRGIIEQCSAKWKTDYPMVEYCEREQQSAKDSVSNRERSHTINDSIYVGIHHQCQQKWGGDFTMVDYARKNKSTRTTPSTEVTKRAPGMFR